MIEKDYSRIAQLHNVRRDGEEYLEISYNESLYLFNANRTLDEIKAFYCNAVRKERAR